MAYKRNRNRRLTTILGTFIGLILVFTFVLSLLNIDTRGADNSGDNLPLPTLAPQGQPTAIIVPTPELDPQLTGRLPYVHSSGYFQTFMPAGDDWVVNENPPAADVALARTVIQSAKRLSLFHNFIVPGVEFETLEALSADYLTDTYFADAWGDYDSWRETGRNITAENIVIDFALVADGNDYIARAAQSLRDGWLYVTRLVVPANNPVLLERLGEWVTADFQPYPQMQQLPVNWPTHIDRSLGYMLKYPTNWRIVAGGVGRPVTLDAVVGPYDGKVSVWVEDALVLESLDEARAWVQDTEATAEIVNAQAFDRYGATGYEVAYSYRDTAGDAHSGLIVLLTAANETFYVANLQVDPADIDLLDAESLQKFELEAWQMVSDGFMVLP